ncbi:hypothetical protein CL654_02570 [bacterium]|nr:hypothetical protein [bacterium]
MIFSRIIQKGVLTSLLAMSLVISPSAFFASVDSNLIEIKDPFYGYPTLRAICSCESNLNQYNDDGSVLRGRVNPFDIGICQINKLYHQERIDALGVDIYTEGGNITYAKYLYDKEGDAPWIWSKPCWEKRIK